MVLPPRSLAIFSLSLLAACTHYKVQQSPNLDTPRKTSPEDSGKAKTIQVFFDGTSNNWEARTNVRRRYELEAQAEDPQHPCLYIEGVGVKGILGKALGLGMKDRVLEGYCYLAKHWVPGDRIHIYGFSRGAFQARMLAGLMAHCGLPDGPSKGGAKGPSDAELKKLGEQVWDYCAEHLTDPQEPASGTSLSLNVWKRRLADNQAAIRSQKFSSGWRFNDPEIKLLGIWDTVPGLANAELKDDGEILTGKHQRYKVRPYPNIKTIIHAMSLDEMRSRFEPLIVGPAIDPNCKVYEVWFPGVHSDVGGGYYGDSNDMAGTTLAWMQRIMSENEITKRDYSFYADAHGVLHHPEDAFINSFGSHKQARKLPHGSYVDFSVFKRANTEMHPEQAQAGGLVHRAYEPTLHVEQPDGRTVKTLTIKGKFGYTREEAQRLLSEVGLKLYDTKAKDLDKHPKGNPLSLGQMAVQVISVAPKSEPAPQPKP